jgi:hypothetical protein
MRHLASAHTGTPVAVCLSGGADSSVIAAYTRQQFPCAVAYSYSFGDDRLSEDAAAAQHVAAHLGMPFRLVRADRQDLLDVLPHAILHGQDWRDFNVHAAVVNELLANAIAADHPQGALAFTGDREVGVFAAHGLTVVQPYCWAISELLALPEPVSKPLLMAGLARHRLPNGTLHRPKVRAQIGDLTADTGVLPQLLQAVIDQRWLEAHFRRTLGVRSPADLRRTIRAGIHQSVPLPPVEGDQ